MLRGQSNTTTPKALRWGLAFVVLALAAGPADAQQQQGAAPPADATVGMTRQVRLTPAEEVAQAQTILARMDATRTGVQHQLEKARQERDVVKTLCLNDKLNQLDVAVRSARERTEALSAAAQRNDSELSNHEFTILSVLRQRSDQLTAEANQCIGEEAGFTGETKITSTVDPTLPDEDTNPPTTDPTTISDPPKCTSCSR